MCRLPNHPRARAVAGVLFALVVPACAEQVVAPTTDAHVDGPYADAGPTADGDPYGTLVDAAPDHAPDGPRWPDGFIPAPRNVPSGLLCDIPADYVAQGGDPVNPPCALEIDQLAPPPPAAAPQQLRVVTWNVHFGDHAAGVLLAFAQQPALRDADVIVLQEVPRLDGESDPARINLARELAQALQLNYAFGVEWDRHEVADGGEHGLATLSRYPIGNASLIRHTKVWPGSYYDERQEYGGKATLALDLLVGDRRVRVYNAHFENRDATGAGRATQCGEVLADAALPGQPALQILGGDLNTFLCSPALVDCTQAPFAEAAIQNLLAAGWVDLLPGYDSWTMKGLDLVPMRLDWIFGQGLSPASHAVLQDVRPSDHVPAIATAWIQ